MLEPLELGRSTFVSCRAGAGNGTWLLCRTANALTMAKPFLQPIHSICKIVVVCLPELG